MKNMVRNYNKIFYILTILIISISQVSGGLLEAFIIAGAVSSTDNSPCESYPTKYCMELNKGYTCGWYDSINSYNTTYVCIQNNGSSSYEVKVDRQSPTEQELEKQSLMYNTTTLITNILIIVCIVILLLLIYKMRNNKK